MLRDRYEPLNLFELIPQLHLRLEPQLAQLDRLLEDDALFRRVREDLRHRYPQTVTRGRPSTPVEVILRMLVVMRLYGWSFEQTEYFVNDSLVLRQFCRVYLQRVPDDTTLLRWAKLMGPDTLVHLNDRAVALAQTLQVTRGCKLRVDTTVIETNIPRPSDGALIGDGVRVLSRFSGGRNPCWTNKPHVWAGKHSAAGCALSANWPRRCTARPGGKGRNGSTPCKPCISG